MRYEKVLFLCMNFGNIFFLGGFLLLLFPTTGRAANEDLLSVLNTSTSQKIICDFYSRWSGRPPVLMPPYRASLKLLQQWKAQVRAPGSKSDVVLAEARITATRVYAGRHDVVENTYTMVGVVDKGRLDPVTFIQPSPDLQVEFLPLTKNEPDFILLKDVCKYKQCDLIKCAELYGIDPKTSKFYPASSIPTYRDVTADGPNGSAHYEDRSSLKWSDWAKDGFRELVVNTLRTDKGSTSIEFKNRTDVYSWMDRKLFLVERTDDGKSVMTRNDPRASQEAKACTELLAQRPGLETMGPQVVHCLDYPNLVDPTRASIVIEHAAYPPDEKPLPPSTIHALIEMAMHSSHGSEEAASILWYQSASKPSADDLAIIWNYVHTNNRPSPYLLAVLAYTGDAKVLPYLTQSLKTGLDEKTVCRQSDRDPVFEGLQFLANKDVPFSPKDRYELHRLVKAPCLVSEGDGSSISDYAKGLLNKHNW